MVRGIIKRTNSELVDGKHKKIDPLHAPHRSISFGKKKQKILTKEEALHEERRWILDHAGNTDQYLKYFNMKLNQQQSKINKLMKAKKNFEEEIARLKSNTNV
jgi:hypothetical protein